MPWDLVPVAQDGVGQASHPGARVGARIHQLRLWAARLDVRAVFPPAQAAHGSLGHAGSALCPEGGRPLFKQAAFHAANLLDAQCALDQRALCKR